MRYRSGGLIVLLLLAACAVNPATGKRELSFIGEGREIQLGREADADITASLGLVDDPELQAYLTALGEKLAAVSERPGLPWAFRVVDDPVVNAFALPGGFIYVTRGILERIDSEAELAGVMGHEIGHVTAKHSVRQMSRRQLQRIGMGLGMALSSDVRRFGDALGAGLQLLDLSYSRGDESQADELGLRYLSRAAYDPEAMIGVFRMLREVGGGAESRVPEWQSTHPYPENREAHIRSLMAESGSGPGGRLGRDDFLDRIDGLVYGADPREGFFHDSHFAHPDLEFEIDFPTAWTGINQGDVVAALSPGKDALVTLEFVEGASDPSAELKAFLEQDGVRGGEVRQEDRRGVIRARAPFEAGATDAAVRGEVAFVGMSGRIFRLMGYASTGAWPDVAAQIGASLSSFSRLVDPQILAIQPWRIEIVTLPEAMTLAAFAERFPGPLTPEEVARLNRRALGDSLPAGSRVKRVVGTAF
jgi:predicted Zn-dependent protease